MYPLFHLVMAVYSSLREAGTVTMCNSLAKAKFSLILSITKGENL